MKLRAFVICCLFAAMLQGCLITSFYPIYTKETVVKDDKVVGTWAEFNRKNKTNENDKESLVWEISFPEKTTIFKDMDDEEVANENTYLIVAYDRNAPEYKAQFQVHLFKLDGQLYADFFPLEDVDWKYKNEIMSFHLVPAHTFAKITELDQDKLHFKWMNVGFLVDLIKENQIRIRHENNGRNILLTAGSNDLQKFILKYWDNEDAYKYGAEIEFTRQIN